MEEIRVAGAARLGLVKLDDAEDKVVDEVRDGAVGAERSASGVEEISEADGERRF